MLPMSDAEAAAPPPTMTQAQYARYRGVSEPYVHKLKEQGRLVFAEAGAIDVLKTDAALGGPPGETEEPKPADAASPTFSTWQAQRAEWDAKLSQLKYLREVERLVDRDEVDQLVADIFTDLRTVLTGQFPTRIAPQLASITAERDVLWTLREALEGELTEFAKTIALKFPRPARTAAESPPESPNAIADPPRERMGDGDAGDCAGVDAAAAPEPEPVG